MRHFLLVAAAALTFLTAGTAAAQTALSRAGWTATASATSGSDTAGKAIDGNASTRWTTGVAQASGQWLTVDMKASRTFTRVTVDAAGTTQYPRTYSVFVSNDGTSWGTAVASGTGTTPLVTVNFTVRTARYVRVSLTGANASIWSVHELQVFGTSTTAPAALPRTGWVAAASASSGTDVPANALDGNTTKRWRSGINQAANQWFTVDMGTARSFTQITLDAAGATTEYPRNYQVQTSSDGVNWGSAFVAGGGASSLVTIMFPIQTARHFRISLTGPGDQGWAINELNVYGPLATCEPSGLSRAGWVASASQTGSTNVASRALDGDPATKWTTGIAQANGQWFRMDMVSMQTFSKVTLDAGTSTGGYPRGYNVHVSSDGVNWGSPIASGTGTTQLVTVTFAPRTSRWLKVYQTGSNSTPWSIHELNVYPPCACPAQDQCHTAGTFDPATGLCSNAAVANGGACGDGNTCSQSDTCQAGACTGGTALACNSPGQCQTGTGTCQPATGTCSYTAKANGTSCNDTNACTQGDTCQAGACAGGSPVVCTASDQCHVAGTCNTSTGVCSNPARPNGDPCSDGNACTQGDSCQAGSCAAGTPLVCTASDQCHVAGTCNTTTGVCSNPAKANGTSCTDGNACTQGDTCQTGICAAGTPLVCTASDQCHVAGTCNTATGVCSNPAKANGTSCTDGNACTQTDTCQAGTCAAGTPLVCTAQDQCHVAGTCNTTTGVCSNPAKADGTSCTDGNACTQTDTCQGGACSGSSPVVCTAQDSCHAAGTCDPGTGVCSNPPIACNGPIVNAGEDVALTTPARSVVLQGLATPRPGQPGGPISAGWTMVSGPATAFFEVPTQLATNVVFPAEGTYVLRLTVVLNGETGSDDVVVTVSACPTQGQPLDVVLVVDTSTSMEVEGKFEAAKLGAKHFVDRLDFTRDQVAVIQFNIGAYVNTTLTNNATAAKAAIDGMFTNPATNIGQALEYALAELQSVRHNPASLPLIVFLSDGGNSWGDPEPGLAALAASGIRSIALGLGSDIDLTMLKRIASSAGDYYYSPSGEDLSWIYSTISLSSCRNNPPLVRTSALQTAYSVRLPHILTLEGEVHDDGPVNDPALTSEWTQVSGPAPVSFVDATAPVTQAVFTDPGTYVLRLTATDGLLTSSADATVNVDPAVSLVGGNLAVSVADPGPIGIGGTQIVSATLTDAGSVPIADFVVSFAVTGVNPTTATATTNASGVATFSYIGTRIGSDQINATALGGAGTLAGMPVTLQWVATNPGPQITQGWFGAPAHQSVVTGQVPITLAAGVTLTSGTVTYWPMSQPDQVGTLTTTAAGGPGATLATLDTTLLANGSYIIKLEGVDNTGHLQTNLIAVTVTGDYKPGRTVVDINEFSIPLPGMPLNVSRHYDSLERHNVGDFGNGWSLALGHPRLESDPGHNVTLTLPGGRRVTFFFTPTGFPSFFSFLYGPVYTPEAGAFGTLTSDGCPLLTLNAGKLVCFLSGELEYTPTTFTYTDPYGRAYTMGATGELRSIKDLQGNILTIAANGITSSSGDLNVPFERDTSGRITKITVYTANVLNLSPIYYIYQYNAAGNLVQVTLPEPGVATVVHEYDGDHRLTKTVDPRGAAARTSTYDAAGRLLTDTNARNETTSYAYNLTARTTTITNPDTGVITQAFDTRGLLLSQTDPLNRTTAFGYDAQRNKTSETNALNETTTYTYDAQGNQTSVTDALGRITRTSYNQFGAPISSTDPLGNITTVVYDDNSVPVRFRDNMGTLATFTSSPRGLPLSVTDANGATTYMTYDPFGNMTSKTDRLGRKTTHEYDSMGRLLATTDPRLTRVAYSRYGRGQIDFISTSAPTWGFIDTFYRDRRHNYDVNGNLTLAYWRGHSRSTSYAYDAANNVTSITYPDGRTVAYTYDFRGNRLTETDELGRVTGHVYDTAGQLIRTNNPDTTFTLRAYDDLGRLSVATDERGHTTSYEYEAGCGCADRITKITDALNRATVMTYDGRGRRLSSTDPAGRRTDFVYDARGRLTETQYADGTTTHDGYDAVGRRITHTDQAGVVTTYGYDAEEQLTSVTDAAGQVTQYAYDGTGKLVSTTDANNHVTTQEYDALGLQTKRTLPVGMSETFAYDYFDNRSSHTDFRGKTTTFTYDVRDRLLTRVPDATLGETSDTYTYTYTGQRASMTDASGTTTYAYDTRDRLLTKGTPQGTLTYTYDGTGNVATIRSSNANGTSVDYTWDAANQLTTITDNRTTPGVTTQNFTVAGLPDTRTQPNGVQAVHSYNTVHRLTNLLHQRGTTLASYAYALSPTGNRLSGTAANGRVATYTYDELQRLTGETITGDPISSHNGAIGYTLDAAGNRLTRTSTLAALPGATHTYDANDRLASDTYDANGNTLTSDGKSFTYDSQNRLTSMNAGAVTYLYDCDGARVGKTAGGVTTRYLVDDLNPTGYSQVLEEFVAGSVRRVYTYGQMLISQSQLAGATWTPSYYGYDGHGSVTFLTDSTGAVTDTYDYDAYGNLVASTGTTANDYLYNGQRWDADLGMFHLRARYYDVGRGRFSSLDPAKGSLVSPISSNKYLYANADPANQRDPLGLLAGSEYVKISGIAVAGLGVIYNSTRSRSSFQKTADETDCSYEGVLDDFSAIWEDDMIRSNPHCPEYLCTCKCPVDDRLYEDLISLRLISPLGGKPPKFERGVGVGLTKPSATIRCFNDAENNIEKASYNANNYFGTSKAQCTVTECELR